MLIHELSLLVASGSVWLPGFKDWWQRRSRVFTNVPLKAMEVVRLIWMEIEQLDLAHSNEPGDQVDTRGVFGCPLALGTRRFM